MTKEDDQAQALRPDRFRIEVGYVLNIVGTWDGRDGPMTFGMEFPESLAEVEVSAADLLAGTPMSAALTSPKALRRGLEQAVGMGVKLAGGIARGDLAVERLMEHASYASSDGVELSHEERVARLREIADEVGTLKRAQAH